jgi:hypothetical protein
VALDQELLQLRDAVVVLGGEGAQVRHQAAVDGEPPAQHVAERPAEHVLHARLLLVEQPPVQEGVLGQHAVAEGVDGADGRRLERRDRLRQPRARGVVDGPRSGPAHRARATREHLAQARAHLGPQLRRGAFGERDRQDLLDRHLADDHRVHDQVLERVGLAGAGRRLEHGSARDRDPGQDGRLLHPRGLHQPTFCRPK